MFHKKLIEEVANEQFHLGHENQRLKEKVEWLLEEHERRDTREAMLLEHLGIKFETVQKHQRIIKAK